VTRFSFILSWAYRKLTGKLTIRISLGELSLSYETYHTRILFFERNVLRTLTYSILAYAYHRALAAKHLTIVVKVHKSCKIT